MFVAPFFWNSGLEAEIFVKNSKTTKVKEEKSASISIHRMAAPVGDEVRP
jgi:hypothetical protein